MIYVFFVCFSVRWILGLGMFVAFCCFESYCLVDVLVLCICVFTWFLFWFTFVLGVWLCLCFFNCVWLHYLEFLCLVMLGVVLRCLFCFVVVYYYHLFGFLLITLSVCVAIGLCLHLDLTWFVDLLVFDVDLLFIFI